jgi:hypothetical protein
VPGILEVPCQQLWKFRRSLSYSLLGSSGGGWETMCICLEVWARKPHVSTGAHLLVLVVVGMWQLGWGSKVPFLYCFSACPGGGGEVQGAPKFPNPGSSVFAPYSCVPPPRFY